MEDEGRRREEGGGRREVEEQEDENWRQRMRLRRLAGASLVPNGREQPPLQS